MREVFEWMDTLSFVAVAGVFLVFLLFSLIGQLLMCKGRCDK